MISGFEVLNYRSVLGRGPHGEGQPAELDIEEDITTLIGKNEAGKSNLLRAINRFRTEYPLSNSNLSNYEEYSDSLDSVEILRCKLSSGALDDTANETRSIPWLLGPYRCKELQGFPVRESLGDVLPIPYDSTEKSILKSDDLIDTVDADEILILGQALATGRVEIVHYASGDIAVDIVGTPSSDDLLIRDEVDFPITIEELLAKRLNEHLRLCCWFIRNIAQVANLNPEVEDIDDLNSDVIETKLDLREQIADRLESISAVFNHAEPIETPPEDTQDDIAYNPPDISLIQKSADELLRTLNSIHNPTTPVKDLPNIIDHSDIDLADSEYNLRNERQNQVVQGILALDNINIANYSSFHSSEFRSSLDNAFDKLSRYLNGFWDFSIDERQPLETITPEDTDRYRFDYELDEGTIQVKLAEGDSPATPLDQRSDGMRWIITFLLTILAQPYAQSKGRQTLVTLDDPGIHLHPEAEKKLFRAFFYAINQTQIVYTTHSPALIDRKEVDRLRIIKHRTQKEGDDLVGTTIANDLDEAKTDGEQVDPLATAREAVGWTLSDSLFRGKQTVLVEGSSDKRYLELFNSYFNWNGSTSLSDDPTFVDSKGSQLPFLSRILAAEDVVHVALMDDDTSDKDFERELKERTIRYNDILMPDTEDYEAEIEDLFDREFLIKTAGEVHEELNVENILETPYDEVPTGIVDYIENFLEEADGIDELDKAELSRKIKERLQPELRESAESHSETIARFQTVITKIKSTLEELDEG